MLNKILYAFKADAPQQLSPHDARLALAALMVRLARADDDYSKSEEQIITALLQDRYNLDADQAAELRTHAEALEKQAPDTVRFTRTVKDAVPYEHRIEVVEALWSVALNDQHRDAEEDGFMRLVVNLLGVTDRDSGLARQRVAVG